MVLVWVGIRSYRIYNISGTMVGMAKRCIHMKEERTMKQCNKCWWKPVCKKTKKACLMLMGVDMRWIESPNNKSH